MTRLVTLESAIDPANLHIYLVGSEPEPVDVPEANTVIHIAFIAGDGSQDAPFDLSQPLPEKTKAPLARKVVDPQGPFIGYHGWDATMRKFVSPHVLRRLALPRS